MNTKFVSAVCALALLGDLSLAACNAAGPTLDVELVTGLVAGAEFDYVETTLYQQSAASSHASVVAANAESRALLGRDYGGGRRVASFTQSEGEYRVRVRLLRRDGSLLVEQAAQLNLQGNYVLRVHITRDCVGVACPGSNNPNLSACLGGRCVDPRCTSAATEFCPEITFCANATACEPTSECATRECVEGICTQRALPDACAADEWCNPDVGAGCMPLLPMASFPCGTICTDDAQACKFGFWNCESATPYCDPLTNRPSGTECGAADVCDLGGQCVACPSGASCTIGCRTGTVSCATGVAICALNTPIVELAEGEACREVGTCIEGSPCDTTGICNATGSCIPGGTTAGVVILPTFESITTEAGASAELGVRLASEPTSDVTLTLSSTDESEGTVSPRTLTFTPSNWSGLQTLTVVGVDDPVADGTQTFSISTAVASGDARYSALSVADVHFSNLDDETAGISVSPTTGLSTSEAGGTDQFSIRLYSAPTSNVTIALSTSDTSEGNVSPLSVVFTPLNWAAPQIVTVAGADDAIADGTVAYLVRTIAAVSDDAQYAGLDASDVSVSNIDNETAGFTISPLTGLTTTELGASSTFSVRLNTEPTRDVIVDVSSTDSSEGTASPASLTFGTSNWNTDQLVTVTGVDDAIVDGMQIYFVHIAPNSASDAAYAALAATDVSATNSDNETAGVTVMPTAMLVTSEAGATATFTLVLNSQPSADVSINLVSDAPTEGTPSPASVTFTPDQWNVAQTITVTGIDDVVADGAPIYHIVTSDAVSADSNYSGLVVPDVSLTNSDNDTASVLVTPSLGLVTTELGGSAVFSLVLTSRPSADVTLTLTSSDVTEGTVNPSSVTFTASTWDTPQLVSATGVDDAALDGDVGYSIVTSVASSTDPNYAGLAVSDISVINTDSELASVLVTPTAGLVTTEGGASAAFTLVLTFAPTANVSIALSSSDATEGAVFPSSIIFTTSNWNAPQQVTVAGLADVIGDGDILYTIATGAAASADLNYSGRVVADVSVTNIDTTPYSQQAYVKASNTGAGDSFGSARVNLSADGNTLAVAAPFEASNATGIDGNQADNSAANAGAVYIFTRAGSSWTQQAYIKASNTGMSDQFGVDVALAEDGNTLAVGANVEASNATGINGNQADNSAAYAGAVYLFTRTGTVWTQQAYIKPSVTYSSMEFGGDVALSANGDTLAVGASGEDTAGVNSGAVYVFTRSAAVWSQQAFLKAAVAGVLDYFGESVSLSSDGSTLAVGASAEDSAATGIDGNAADNSADASGAAYVFTRTGSMWTQQAYVKASNAGASDLFGRVVALSGDGDTLGVGACYESSNATGINGDQSNNSAGNAGAVYVYTRSGSTWTQQAYVKGSNTESPDLFGFDEGIAFSSTGDVMAIGAPGEQSMATGVGGNQGNSAGSVGAVYIFRRAATVWSQHAFVKASNSNGADGFFRVGLSSDASTLVVGAAGEDSNATGVGGDQSNNSAATSGAVYVFTAM
ncbi:MAG: hypothetical protein IPK60_23640 [Sandaracinaceae bacterium]|nr:hypothetical protein [Sandaracinaceae bacterium]